MTLDVSRIETITFDSFTTLVDVLGSTERALAEYVSNSDLVTIRWRSRAVEYRMLCNAIDHYEPYLQTTTEALEYALAASDEDVSEAAREEIAAVFYELDVFPDVAPSLRQLEELGYDIYIVSNGTHDLLRSIVRRADINEHIVGLISADEIERYKPATTFYEHAAEQIGTPIESIAHVTTPWYDVFGAMNAGMQGVWVNRQGRPWDSFDGNPDLVVEDLHAFVREINR